MDWFPWAWFKERIICISCSKLLFSAYLQENGGRASSFEVFTFWRVSVSFSVGA